jgi:hypothetical protein
LADDGEDVAGARRRTAQQKVNMLELMLGQIANYCPVISRNTIVRNSTSTECIWQTIRLHYGFQSTGAHFIDFCDIKLQPDERPEDLYQRLAAFVEDNLLIRNGTITHHGEVINEDEEISPSLENFLVLSWLHLIHKDLPHLVKQRYGTELRSRTLASIKPEISQALTSLLEEVQTSENVKIMRANTSYFNRQHPTGPATSRKHTTASKTYKLCPLCKQAGRSYQTHFLSQCTYLPETDRKYMAKARQITNIMLYDDDTEGTTVAGNDSLPEHPLPAAHQGEETYGATALRVQVRQSPYITAFYGHRVAHLTIDSGATGNMIQLPAAKSLGVDIQKSTQSAHQADGMSPLKVVGETRFTVTRDNRDFKFEGLVVEKLDVDILAGIPFMECNDISVRPAKHQVLLGDGTCYLYGLNDDKPTQHTVRRTHVLRAPQNTPTIWPGEYLEVKLPEDMCHMDEEFAVEPRSEKPESGDNLWPRPDIFTSVAGRIRIPNLSDRPQTLKRHEHFCQVSGSTVPNPIIPETDSLPSSTPCTAPQPSVTHADTVKLDPDNIFPQETKMKFKTLLYDYNDVFDSKISGYNGASGPFQAVVNMGPVQPPQRKGRVPQYSRNKLVELQQKFDDLEALGVFVRPEDVGIPVEYLNPSFLVKKSSGGFRLVTAFADVGRYSKPQPSLMPDVDSILRQIASWKYIITSDLTLAFHQIPLSRESMKYCGVATPFKGVRVYARCAMGMPGSETALEELMCRVLGELQQEGVVTKLADDLYCGANNLEDLLNNWHRVLDALQRNNLRLAASKTVIGPSSVTILGWKWQQGTIRATPHRIATLSTCSRPENIGGLRSFIGAYKVLARVLPQCASFVSPLDDAQAGQQSQAKIQWSDDLNDAFTSAQNALTHTRTITLPRPDDQLWIITDGAVKRHGLGATLYVTRDGKPHLAGFFSAKLRGRQITWLPCEIEALSIAIATKHFSPYIIQSHHNTCILTDSKPCVQAFEKLCRGEFSASPRVSTFLSIVSRYQASVRHLSGSANVPSDFASRNAPECHDSTCQVCSFVQRTEDCVVSHLSVQDIVSGNVRLPYTSRAAWLTMQAECPDLRRTHAHLKQGTRPSKKQITVKDIKRYLNVATIAKDGLLVVRRCEPLAPTRDCIIVPRDILHGLLTAIHIQLDHPSCHQLKLVTHRYFFALDMDKAIELVTKSCHHCSSLSKIPHPTCIQSTCDPPESIGLSFAADVMKRERQLVLVIRECVTSFTAARVIEDERHETLRNALLQLCIEMKPLDGPPAIVRVDPAPGFQALSQDELLKRHNVSLEIGRTKNLNKNPVAERAIQELEHELLCQDPGGRSLTPLTLAISVARLNTRIRARGLSSREMWTQRDQFSNIQIPLSDRSIIEEQHSQRLSNHRHSETSKCPSRSILAESHIAVGDLVYLHNDGNKLRARNRYLVVSVEESWCNIRKFTGSQLRNTSYRVKKSDCYKVPDQSLKLKWFPNHQRSAESSDDDSAPSVDPPVLPSVPAELSIPGGPTMQPILDRDSNLTDQIEIICTPSEDLPVSSEDAITGTHTDAPRRSTRIKRLPTKFDDFYLN